MPFAQLAFGRGVGRPAVRMATARMSTAPPHFAQDLSRAATTQNVSATRSVVDPMPENGPSDTVNLARLASNCLESLTRLPDTNGLRATVSQPNGQACGQLNGQACARDDCDVSSYMASHIRWFEWSQQPRVCTMPQELGALGQAAEAATSQCTEKTETLRTRLCHEADHDGGCHVEPRQITRTDTQQGGRSWRSTMRPTWLEPNWLGMLMCAWVPKCASQVGPGRQHTREPRRCATRPRRGPPWLRAARSAACPGRSCCRRALSSSTPACPRPGC